MFWTLALIALGLWLYREFVGKRKGLPPGPTPLPLLGNIASLDPTEPVASLDKFRKAYGDTFTFWLGVQPVVVLTGLRSMRSVFTGKTADAVVERPDNAAIDAFYGEKDGGMAGSNGWKWKEGRRFSMHALRDLGFGKSSMETAILEEGHRMLQHVKDDIGGQREGELDPLRPLTEGVVNVISRVLFDVAHERGEARLWQLGNAITTNAEVLGSLPALLLADSPWLRHIPILDNFGHAACRRCGESLREALWSYVDEVKARMANEGDAGDSACFVEAYLREIRKREVSRSSAPPITTNAEVLGSLPALLLADSPWLRHIPILDNFGHAACRRCGESLREALWSYVDEVKARMANEGDAGDSACFVEAYLREIRKREANGEVTEAFTEEQMVRVVGDFWAGGYETSVTTLRWGILHLARNPKVQKKLHSELAGFYGEGGERPVSMDDRAQLPYTTAVIMEIQRMANLIPFNLAHRTSSQIEVDGFAIPAGTAILPNVGSVLWDAEVFPEPLTFDPQRFLDPDSNLLKSDGLLPFGLGKRNCAGESLAKMELFMFTVLLFRRFEFLVSPAAGPPPLKAMAGLLRKPRPFTVLVSDRMA